MNRNIIKICYLVCYLALLPTLSLLSGCGVSSKSEIKVRSVAGDNTIPYLLLQKPELQQCLSESIDQLDDYYLETDEMFVDKEDTLVEMNSFNSLPYIVKGTLEDTLEDTLEKSLEDILWVSSSGFCPADDNISMTEYNRLNFKFGFPGGFDTERKFLPLYEKKFPLPFNREVERNIKYFCSEKMRAHFRVWLERSARYRNMMAEIFRDEGLSPVLVYLALIESGFNPKAYSWQRASGPWQFIESTGRMYGLRVNWWVDERRDPIKSTTAAARHLRDLFERFGSWDLAMAAYNAGEGKIRRAVLRTKTDDYWKIRKTRHIRRETKNYVPRYIAATMIAENPDKYGFRDIDHQDPFIFDEVVLKSAINLKTAARLAGVSVKDIKELNPELRRWATPPYENNYVLRLPKGSRDVFQKNFENEPPEKLFAMLPYRIQSGDTLTKIARRYGVPLRVLRDMNSSLNPRRLRIGKVIRVPSGVVKLESGKGMFGNSAIWPYRVRKGDTLFSIARRYKVRLRTLIRLNPQVHPKRLQIGDLIHIPARSA